MLKLNEEKTEFMVIVSKYYCSVYNRFHPTLSIGGVTVAASNSLRNLGVTLDSTMTMRPQMHGQCEEVCVLPPGTP